MEATGLTYTRTAAAQGPWHTYEARETGHIKARRRRAREPAKVPLCIRASAPAGSMGAVQPPNDTPSIWEKIDYSLVPRPTTPATPAERGGSADDWWRFWKRRRPMLDVLGVVLWTYALLKVFVTDLDRKVLGDIAGYRLFAFIGGAALVALVFRKAWPTVGALAYVLGFPLVVACWKLPRLLYRSGSPVAFLATINAVTSFLADIKHSIIVTAAAAFAALAIALSHSKVLLGAAGMVVCGLLIQSLYRTIKFSIMPARFLRMQQRGIRRAAESDVVKNLTSPAEDLQRVEIEKFDKTQQDQFVQGLANGVIAHRLLNFWAYQLERYRRSPASIFFNGLSYGGLILRVVLALALLNLALYHADPRAFAHATPPTFLVILRYVIADLYGSEIQGLQAVSDGANALSVATVVVGLMVVGSLLLSSVLSFRASRDQSEIQETIAQIKNEGDRLDERLQKNFDVSVPEAIERLEQLKFSLMGLITFLSTRIPKEFEERPGRV